MNPKETNRNTTLLDKNLKDLLLEANFKLASNRRRGFVIEKFLEVVNLLLASSHLYQSGQKRHLLLRGQNLGQNAYF